MMAHANTPVRSIQKGYLPAAERDLYDACSKVIWCCGHAPFRGAKWDQLSRFIGGAKLTLPPGAVFGAVAAVGHVTPPARAVA